MFATFAAMERRWLVPARVRARIYEAALTRGRVPSLAQLAEAEGAPLEAVRETVALLGARHHVVPGPDGELIAAHPFAARPTAFAVRFGDVSAWGFCIWDALGIVAMAGGDGQIETACADCARPLAFEVRDGRLQGDIGAVAQLLVPARRFWDDVVFTCSTQLAFCEAAHAAAWRERRGMAAGELVPMERLWALARVWYGEDRRQRHWRRRTVREAEDVFAALGLTAPFWRLSSDGDGDAGRVLRVFVDADGGGGNRTVVLEGACDEAALRAAAARLGAEATWIDRRATPAALRFFLPSGEMAFCGHGALGAATALANGVPGTFTVVAGGATHELAVRADGVAEWLAPPADAVALAESDAAWALDALGLEAADRAAWPLVNAGGARPKTLVPLASAAALDAIVTSEARVAAACAALGTSGLYPFVVSGRDGDTARVEARQFPAGAGFLEDAATGVAGAALLAAWRTLWNDPPAELRIGQGRAMSAPSELWVRLTADGRVAVGGRVRA